MLGQRREPEAPWGNATAQALKQPTSPSHQGQVVGHEVEVGASALRNQAGWEGGWLDTSVRRGLRGARECGSIFAREYSKLRADGPHANELKVGDPFLSPAEIVSRRRR